MKKIKFFTGLFLFLATMFVCSTSAKGSPTDAGVVSVSVSSFAPAMGGYHVESIEAVSVSYSVDVSYNRIQPSFTCITGKEAELAPPDCMGSLSCSIPDIEKPNPYQVRSPLTGHLKHWHYNTSIPDLYRCTFTGSIHSPPKIV